MFAAVYAFYRYVKAPSAARLAGVGLAAKHNAILVFPMFLGLALYELLRRQRPAEQPDLQSLPRKARTYNLPALCWW
jgi:predicted membrane-bound mannosyltransferase